MSNVSILLPTYNGAKYVREAIESVLNQSYQDWELIIIDDGSTDNIDEVAGGYVKKDPRITYERNKKNLGLSGNLNKGLLQASGQYIARIDQDDVWIDIDKLKKQIKFLDAHPDCVLVGTGFRMVDESGEHIRDVVPFTDDRSIRGNILSENQFGHATVVFRKKPVIDLGGYNSKIRYGEDYDLWLRLGQKGTLANIRDICMQYRVCNGMSQKHSRWNQIKLHFGLLRRYGSRYPGLLKAIALKVAHGIKWIFVRPV